MLNILEILRFFQHVCFFLNHPKFENFERKKNRIYVLEDTLKNVCTKFQVIPFINVFL